MIFRLKNFLFLILTIFVIFPTFSIADTQKKIQTSEPNTLEINANPKNYGIKLSPQETTWLKKHLVKVGVEDWPPILFSETGNDMQGVTADIFKEVARRVGLRYQIISDKWNNLLTCSPNL